MSLMATGESGLSGNRIEAAARFLRGKGIGRPSVALILGSGLGRVAESVENAVAISVEDIPFYPAPSVRGHTGQIVAGRLEGVDCIVFQGRVHMYEGRSRSDVVFPIELAAWLGASEVVLTNAAGGIAPDLEPGSIMLIESHLSLFPAPSFGRPHERTVGYDREVLERLESAAVRARIRSRRGTYAWTSGPSYETPAEIRALRRVGADAVGMSTVPEVLCAIGLGMRCGGVSAITNRAAGLSSRQLDHRDVIKVAARVADSMEALLRQYLLEGTRRFPTVT